MTRLFLIRHGETEWSRSGQHTSYTDLPLTDKGREQAAKLLGHLEPADFGLILSSPRQRAVQTAELAGFTGAHRPLIDPDLVEWNYGEYEGLTRRQIQEQEPGWTIWTHGGGPGGESAADVRLRLRRLIDRIEGSGAEQAICFAHGHALRAMTMVWLDLELSTGAHFELDTATLSVLIDDEYGRSIQRWNAGV